MISNDYHSLVAAYEDWGELCFQYAPEVVSFASDLFFSLHTVSS